MRSDLKPKYDLQKRIKILEEKISDYERLHKILLSFPQSVSIEATLKDILEAVMKICEGEQASIMLFSPTKAPTPRTLIREGKSEEEVLDHYLNNLLSGWVSAHGKSLLTNTISESFSKESLKNKHLNIKSALSVPLNTEGETLGVINVITCKPEKILGSKDLELVEHFASYCVGFVKNAQLNEKLFAESQRLKRDIEKRFSLPGIIGQSESMQAVFSILERIIPTEVQVLIQGDSGTGKEQIARAIHYNGPRREESFVAIDCGSLPANLLESELFGYVKGAFTGAQNDTKGLFEEANNGTIFLDEITNMPYEIQAKFLRALQEREIRPVGSTKSNKINVRIVAAASADLERVVESGDFRKDLYYRLNVVKIKLPALKERISDIPLLAHHFLKEMKKKYKKNFSGFDPEVIKAFESYSWPGNIREMEHAIERAVVLSNQEYLSVSDFDLLDNITIDKSIFEETKPLHEAISEFKKQYISTILKHTSGKQSKAAEILKIQRTYLNRLLKELGLSTTK
jgi:Nif-specific regulatory protein